MITRIIVGGFGGQGVLILGYVLATAAMYEGRYATYLPAYGAEMRGGTANCTVTISDEPIASPVASSSDIAILMNKPACLRFEKHVRQDGVILTNSDLTTSTRQPMGIEIVGIPANTIAKKIGDLRTPNMVMCGGFAEKTRLISLESIINSVKDIFAKKGPKVCEINAQALREGAAYIKNWFSLQSERLIKGGLS
jgi:2-oxoglutarate ferredoxin oxidoreductase subunit gamma